MRKAIRSIAIVGDGAVAWLAASTLLRVLAPQGVTVCVVASNGQQPPLPENASLPSLGLLHRAIGIGEPEFMRSTRATFKLGVDFIGWSGTGGDYFHPHGQMAAPLEGIPFHHYWLKHGKDAPPLADFSLAAVAARLGHFSFPAADQRSVLSTLDYAYHLDSDRYTQFLRTHACANGASAPSAKLIGSEHHPETGFIEHLILEGGERIAADLYIDCSPDRVLIEGVLQAGFEDWSHWFSCDRMVTVRVGRTGAPAVHTDCIAESAGWQWRIPLQDCVSAGYVYSSRHANDDEAARVLLTSIGGSTLDDPQWLPVHQGLCKEVWKANVIAMGDAAGILEPQEWTGLHLAQSALLRLTTLFPDKHGSGVEAAEFNRLTAGEWERARDFVLAHYVTAARADTPFWIESRSVTPPALLARKIEMFRNRGHVTLCDDETFDTSSWASIFLGQGVMPRRLDPLVAQVDPEQSARTLQRMHSIIRQAADSMAAHAVVLEKTGAMARRPA